MTWPVIARHDGQMTIGERSVKLLLGILVTVIVLAAYVYPVLDPGPITTAHFSGYVDGWVTVLVPLLGILFGYDAIVSERSSGSLYLTLSLPHSRRDLVIGKLVGRAGVLTIGLCIAGVLAGFLVVYPYGELEIPRSIAFFTLTIWFGVIWTGLGVAVSMATETKQRALLLGAALFFVLSLAWDSLQMALATGLNTAGVIDGSLPNPVQFVFSLEPVTAYERVIAGFIDPEATVAGPWYLGEWVGLLVLLLWLVLPLFLAYGRFVRGDLA